MTTGLGNPLNSGGEDWYKSERLNTSLERNFLIMQDLSVEKYFLRK